MKAFEQRLRKAEAKHATTRTGKTLFPEWLMNDWEDARGIPHNPDVPDMERALRVLATPELSGLSL